MAKKKEQTATITKPKVGKSYRFQFAGGQFVGTLEGRNDKLTQHYGHAWFWMRVSSDSHWHHSGDSVKKDMRYPVSIYNLIAEENVR